MMVTIAVIGIIPEDDFRLPALARAALMHGLFRVIGETADAYIVLYLEVRAFFIAQERFQAVEEWDIFRPLIVHIPKDCAEVVKTQVPPCNARN